MQQIVYNLRKSLRPYINCIMTDTSIDPEGIMTLPLYADGYPGLMFQQSANGFYLLPRNKKLSELFLYGQTIDPIQLRAKGKYAFTVFQLYPFASKYLLNIDPKVLNDDCYDLLQLRNISISDFFEKLNRTDDPKEQIEILSDIVEALLAVHRVPEDDRIQRAIEHIIQANGRISIREVQNRAFITERTLERNFLGQVGLTPKQFAGIVQFQSSLELLDADDFDKLIQVGLDSGFSDQSHFIRVFKKYTGLTPSEYLRQASPNV